MVISSTKKRRKIAIRAMPSGHEYAVIGPVKHSLPSASLAGARSCSRYQQRRDLFKRALVRTWMNAVAIITPLPKYFAMKKAHPGIPTLWCLAAKTGNQAPRKDPTKMTKMEETLTPIRPSKSLSVGHVDMLCCECRASQTWLRARLRCCSLPRPSPLFAVAVQSQRAILSRPDLP